MYLRSLAFAASLLASLTAPVLAEETKPEPLTGLYIGAGAGVNWMQNRSFGKGYLDSNTGFATVVSIGYAMPNGLRFELEGDYRRNAFARGSNFSQPTTASGTEQKYGFMVNVLYDLSSMIPVPVVQPYVGVGLGYSLGQLNSVALASPSGVVSTGGTQGSLAYQAIIGAAYPIEGVRGLAVTAEYRFFGTTSRDYNVTAFPINGGAPIHSKVTAGNDFNHAIMLGVRYNFGAPPPPAPTPIVAPAPSPARSYLVFFDWDRADLTDRARQIIADAARNSTRVQYTRIEVNGYTDTSGTPKHNMGLSIRRAKAVEGELIRNGVPQDIITIQGFGDTNLLIQTGPGVREPQNRRVEIIIR